jgi:hypothetical protein
MFLSVLQGRVDDAGAVRTSLDRWMDQVAAGARGWLGTTAGVTDDGTSISLTRFRSADAARRNADRPEQTRWWQDASALYADPVTVKDARVVMTQLRGDSDDAGFVQVLQGHIADIDRTEHLLEGVSPWQAEVRPDIIGGLLGLHDDGGFTQTVYFTSEAAARNGERTEWPAQLLELDRLIGDVTYLDLREPWMLGPP